MLRARHRIRPLAPDDLVQVAALRGHAFRTSLQPSQAALTRYLRHIFLDSPLRDDAIPPIVYEAPDGRIDGFLGVVVQPMQLGPRRIRAAIATQLMASSQGGALVGRKLARAFCSGQQELSMSDTANAGARTLWMSIGGQVAFAYSLRWVLATRPTRWALAGPGAARRALAMAARPAAAGLDALLHRRARRRHEAPAGDRATDFHPPDEIALIDELAGGRALRPAYDAVTLAWLMKEVERRPGAGPVSSCVVFDAGNAPLGWFSYMRDSNDVAQVIHLCARRRDYHRVLAQLVEHAHARGALALSGRTDPSGIDDLSAMGCAFHWDGPWTCLHTAHPQIRVAIECGSAYLSRLEGEWWMRF